MCTAKTVSPLIKTGKITMHLESHVVCL